MTRSNLDVDDLIAAGSGQGQGAFCPVPRLRDHVAGLPVLESHTAQFGPGPSGIESQQACGADMVIVRLKLVPKLAGHIILEPAWLCLMIPLRFDTEFRFSGLIARPDDLFLASGSDGYATVGERRDTVAVGIRKPRLQAAMRAAEGQNGGTWPFPDQRIALGQASGKAFRRSLLAALDASTATSDVIGRGSLAPVVEAHLIDFVARALLPHVPARDPADLVAMEPLRVVRAAQREIDAVLPRKVTLKDLCAVTGASPAWLHRCFCHVYGISPIAYLRARRLREARSRLLDPATPAKSIKDVALSLGFSSSGRFAAEYREIFDENPSETLARGIAQGGGRREVSP